MIKKNWQMAAIIIVAVIFFACTKDRNLQTDDNVQALGDDTTLITAGMLKINEFVAKGSTNANENGNYEDWFEIYNPNGYAVNFAQGHWFVTDDLSEKNKFELPPVTIPAYGFLLIWCDEDTGNDIHTGFKLSSGGESLGVFYNNGGDYITIDELDFDAQSDGVSKGRYPDGSDNWIFFTLPTPGQSNN